MLRTLLLRALLALAPLAPTAHAAEFGVTPIRLDFERAARSAVVSVSNDDARPLRMQVKLMEWTQDAAGQDQYRESDELIYFPKMMVVQPKERRLVRIGLKTPMGAGERTYRLFLDELPDDAAQAAAGSGLSFSIRFALPVFLPPAAAAPRGALDGVTLEDGNPRVAVPNHGHHHCRVASVHTRP